jgi:hypothetical protein
MYQAARLRLPMLYGKGWSDYFYLFLTHGLLHVGGIGGFPTPPEG